MKIVLLGPPGSGKGTQAKLIADYFKLEHISTGDLFREEIRNKSELGVKIKHYIEEGKLVPDEIVIQCVKNKIESIKDGFILDGFPRTLDQCYALEKITEIDFVFNINVSDKVIIERITSRRICPKCNRVYNLKLNPPKEDELCDFCKVKLIQRDDDKEEVIKNRLKEYNKYAKEIVDFYKKKGKLFNIDGERQINDIFNEIVNIIKNG